MVDDMTSSISDEFVTFEKLSVNDEGSSVFPVKTSNFHVRGVGEQKLTIDLVVSKFSNLTQITVTSVGKPGKVFDFTLSIAAMNVCSCDAAA